MPLRRRIVGIVQARLGSMRFPGKVMAEICGHPMLWHGFRRVREAKLVDEVVVATTTEPLDDTIFNFCTMNRIGCYRGKQADVLDRFYQTAKRFNADVVVRITSDCPLIDPWIVDRVISTYLEGGFDYVTNALHYTFPDGLDTEVFSFAALKWAWKEACLPAEREHVTPYMRTSGQFRIHNVENEVDLSDRNLRWTVDEPSDIEFIRTIYERMGEGEEIFGLSDVLELLKRDPSLTNMNKNIVRNTGFYKSLASEGGVPPRNRELRLSFELKKKAERLIPSLTQTFSKGPTQFVQGVAPLFLIRGQGSHVWDVDNNEYIDYPMALGPVILGHSYPAVNEAVIRQMQAGTIFSLPHPLEIMVSEMLVELIPCAEMVRFCKNGSDATAGAVRAARAYTGRDYIACCGYHGWQDWYIGTTTRNKGVPKAVQELTIPFEYNNLDSLERIFAEHPRQVAAVIMEPVGVVEPQDNFLQKVQELAQHEGTLLIFDEVVTGFRLSLGGGQEYFKVIPDLACFGKAIANGYPIAAIVGRREIMQLFDEIFFSFTFGGETLSLAASLATMTEMREKKVIAHLWEYGQKLKDGYNVLAREFGVEDYTQCEGMLPRTVITFRDRLGIDSLVLKSLFQQECLKRGVLFSGNQNLCYSHSEADIEYTLRVYRTALEILGEAIKSGEISLRLEGQAIQPVFRRA